jgi:hypothetical protein
VVPQNVEKLPLFHWRPGARLLTVGSRDGADFAGDPHADRNTFQREVTPEFLAESRTKLHVDGLAATWSASLNEPTGIDTLLAAAADGPLVIATPGIGDATVLDRLLPRVDAWLLLVTADEKPLDRRILAEGRHVEVLVGLAEGAALPALPWEQASAIHLCSVRTAEADRIDAWCIDARPRLPAASSVYDHHHPHTDCRSCKERVVWRHGGRSRVDADVKNGVAVCRACGTASTVRVN